MAEHGGRVHSSDGSTCWCRPVQVRVGSSEGYRELARIVGEAVGGGSVCWENPAGAGVFHDQDAKVVVDRTMAELMAKFEIRTRPEA